jgi:peptidoglycan DL-endopeptidase CwlO
MTFTRWLPCCRRYGTRSLPQQQLAGAAPEEQESPPVRPPRKGDHADVPVPAWCWHLHLRAAAGRLALVALAVGVAALAVPAAATPQPTRADVERLGDQVSQLDEQLNEARIQLGRLNAELVLAERRVAGHRRAVAATSRRIAERAAAEYKGGGLTSVSALLSGTDSAAVVDRVETLSILARSDGDLLDAAAVQRRALAGGLAEVGRARAAAAAEVAGVARRKLALVRKLQALERLRAQVGEPAAMPLPAGLPPARGSAATAVRVALAQVGEPYHWGAAGPDSFDCSGLTMYAWGRAGVDLPHSSQQQYAALPHVARAALRPGDLVFFGSPIHHVGMYIGGGRMVAAPSSGRTVQVSVVDRRDYVGAGRP